MASLYRQRVDHGVIGWSTWEEQTRGLAIMHSVEAGKPRYGASNGPCEGRSSPVQELPIARRPLDPESAAWVDALECKDGALYEQACARLHALLVRIAMDEVFRRGPRYRIGGPELDDLAHQAAADALMRITCKVHQFRGDARFTTWAFRFVVLEVSNKLGRHFWRTAGIRFEADEWARVPDRHPGTDPVNHWQAQELAEAVRKAVDTALSARQRHVFTALVVYGVPVETLASELQTNPNALYKTVFDSRKKLRAQLAAAGHLG
ncbi:sigma-70 family RNA polymerase sigma factor [Streptomyces sp. NPDC093675]|uniref:sigma-70 family RNA polymerase sigma factor n=1 Tax=Streptomyces sp. NPDC093675 TaxID=3366049 RepID=UPI003810E708